MKRSAAQRWLPSRPLSVVLFGLWLLLVGSVAPGHLLLAAVFAIALPRLAERLRGNRPRVRRPALAFRLAGHVLWDIVLSNIEVARLVLGPQGRIQPGWIEIPLEITNMHGITALAGIITMTPGTLSADLSADQRVLLVHCLNVPDPDATIAEIKARYETPLKEIFP